VAVIGSVIILLLLVVLHFFSKMVSVLENCQASLNELQNTADSLNTPPPASIYPLGSLAEAEDLADQWRTEHKLKNKEKA